MSISLMTVRMLKSTVNSVDLAANQISSREMFLFPRFTIIIHNLRSHFVLSAGIQGDICHAF